MRVLWLGDTRDDPPPNGACVWASQALSLLSERSTRLWVCAPTRHATQSHPPGQERITRISVTIGGDRLTPLNLQTYNRALSHVLTRTPELLSVDLIYDATGYLYSGHFLEWLTKHCQAPLIVHCMLVLRGHLMLKQYPDMAGRWMVGSQERAFRAADRILCLSRAEVAKLAGHDAALESKTSIAPLGTRLRAGAERQWAAAALDTFVVAFAGRSDDPSKGFDVFAVAGAEMLDRLPGIQIRVAGRGGEHPVDARVDDCGWLPPDGMSEFLQRAHVLVVPSREEALGLVAIEAMACGAIVVAAPRGGLRDIVDHDHNGLLLGQDELRWPAEIVEAVRQLRENPARCRRLREAARRTVDERFRIDRSVNGVWSAWVDVVEHAACES